MVDWLGGLAGLLGESFVVGLQQDKARQRVVMDGGSREKEPHTQLTRGLWSCPLGVLGKRGGGVFKVGQSSIPPSLQGIP